MADRYLAEHVAAHNRPSTAAEVRRIVETRIKPELGRVKVSELTRAQIKQWHSSMRATPYEGNRALAYFSKMMNLAAFEWELRDYAHVAEVLGVTQARISQISGLTLLAPEIQEAVLNLPPSTRDPITERQLREIVTEPLWEKQMRLWRLVRRHR